MENEQRILKPLPGFSKELGYYLAMLEKARSDTKELLADLSPEELATRILPNMHSIGALAMHLGECEFWHVQSNIAGRETTEEEKKFSHWLDTLEADYDRGYTAEECIETLDKIWQMSKEVFAKFNDDDLENLFTRKDLTPPVESSLRWILRMMIDHEAHHRGQISMIKRVLRGTKSAS